MIEGTDILALHRTGTNSEIISPTEKWNTEGRSFKEAQVGELKIFKDETTHEIGIGKLDLSSSFSVKPEEIKINIEGINGPSFSLSKSLYSIASRKQASSESLVNEREIKSLNRTSLEDPHFLQSHLTRNGFSLSDETEETKFDSNIGLSISDSSQNKKFSITPSLFSWDDEGKKTLDFAKGDISKEGYFVSYSSQSPVIEFDDTGVCNGHSLYFLSHFHTCTPIICHAKTIDAVCNPIIVFNSDKIEKNIKIRFVSSYPIMIIKLRYQEADGSLKTIIPTLDGWVTSNIMFSSGVLNAEFDSASQSFILKKLKKIESIIENTATFSFIQNDEGTLSGCMNIDFKNKIINFFCGC